MHRCPECGKVAAEPKLRYCEQCGARMPEYKTPTAAQQVAEDERTEVGPVKPPYTGPKWLEHVPGHSPSVLGVILHLIALGLSILPSLAGLGPFWSFVMLMGGVLVVARELRATGEAHPLISWIPASFHPPYVPAVYTALAVAFVLPLLELSPLPLLWMGGTALLVRDQWDKVFAGPEGYAQLFDPRALTRGPRLLALVGVGVCVLALFFTWMPPPRMPVSYLGPPSYGPLRGQNVPRPTTDVVYGGLGQVALGGYSLPVAPTVEVALLGLLVLLMLRPEVDRPEWLRFVPAGVTVIALTWALVNLRLEVGPIAFLVGVVPLGIVAVFQALGREEFIPPLPEDRYESEEASEGGDEASEQSWPVDSADDITARDEDLPG
ncbi:hypothetical protein [Stigmatella aurantiaca]|uniref:Conserved uncharacterized protein n=2 Tax=Stigmatella aurantiaca (strain DW4/3-1) TaxID=378806 RepID=E3FFA9_STIAD|nr:hypothetical protein [Stigmatella aurantiaca]ADO71476.1 conserved uncharacterized protein [Stigmatella aurantiaca DW4/3-1]